MTEQDSVPSGQDKTIACVDCGAQFVFSGRDQAFYQERGYQTPRRCKGCRDKRKSSPHATLGAHGNSSSAPSNGAWAKGPAANSPGDGGDQHKVSCSACGVETTVPFKPDPNRPVYCRACYLSRRKGAKPGAPGQTSAPAGNQSAQEPSAQ
jgi:CxxC-x17-CxxC domain-containing protein